MSDDPLTPPVAAGDPSSSDSLVPTDQNEDLTVLRALASNAMEGEEHRRGRELEDLAMTRTEPAIPGTPGTDLSIMLAKQRQLAEAAMEGPERRHTREATEEAERAQTEALARQKEEAARRARLKAAEETDIKRITTEARERQHKMLEEQHTTIEQLAHNPILTIRPVRTFKEDMNEAIKGNNISLISMAIKENERKITEDTAEVQETKKGHWFAIVSTLLILAGLGIGGYTLYIKFFQKVGEDTTTTTSTYQSIVFAEKQRVIPLEDMSGTQLIALLKNEVKNLNQPLSTIEDIRLITRTVTPTPVPVSRFMALLESHIPASLLRNIRSNFMIGAHSSEESSGFLILQSDNYDLAFAGMLAWEPSLVADLYVITSGRSPTTDLIEAKFRDVVIKNIEARAAYDKAGKMILLYAFFNKDNLIITPSQTTFVEILTRLTTPRPVLQK